MVGVIIQPSYIPWRGFFHMIQRADVFVFYDDVQYDKRGWRNRNRIKGPNGSQWLTIPTLNKGAQTEDTPINAIEICWDTPWNRKHLQTITQIYSKAPFFKDYVDLLKEFYGRRDTLLADFTIDFTIAIARRIGILHTRFVRSSTLGAEGTKTARLISVLEKIGATHYISGPSAADYIEPKLFEEAGITYEYQVYDYPPYEQRFPPYDPQVSILDLMFSTGPQLPQYIWSQPRPSESPSTSPASSAASTTT
jgi:hypothetical protein